jgi:protein arginine kinase activator
MKCEICKVRESAIHVKQVIGTETVDMHLCEVCAYEKGISRKDDKIELSLSQLLTGLLGSAGSSESEKLQECPVCCMKFSQFRKDGRLGCPDCYNVFSDEIRSIHKKLSGVVRHKGKIPKKLLTFKALLIDMEKLKVKLSEAVKKEDYETAADLRDQIKLLEADGGTAHDRV